MIEEERTEFQYGEDFPGEILRKDLLEEQRKNVLKFSTPQNICAEILRKRIFGKPIEKRAEIQYMRNFLCRNFKKKNSGRR